MHPYYYFRNGQNDVIGLFDGNGNIVARYSYDSWGNLLKITDSSGNDKTNDTTFVGYKNPLRYRGYYYDSETKLYYLQSRYYNPEWGRFLNADDVDTVSFDLSVLSDKNLFAYTDNNPVNRIDESGYFWGELAKAIAVATAVVAVTALVVATGGLAVAAVAGGATAVMATSASMAVASAGIAVCGIGLAGSVTAATIELAKNYDPDPYGRPGQKKQGRENKEKKKKDNWTPRNNKRNGKPAEPKHHTPGREHQKYSPSGKAFVSPSTYSNEKYCAARFFYLGW